LVENKPDTTDDYQTLGGMFIGRSTDRVVGSVIGNTSGIAAEKKIPGTGLDTYDMLKLLYGMTDPFKAKDNASDYVSDFSRPKYSKLDAITIPGDPYSYNPETLERVLLGIYNGLDKGVDVFHKAADYSIYLYSKSERFAPTKHGKKFIEKTSKIYSKMSTGIGIWNDTEKEQFKTVEFYRDAVGEIVWAHAALLNEQARIASSNLPVDEKIIQILETQEKIEVLYGDLLIHKHNFENNYTLFVNLDPYGKNYISELFDDSLPLVETLLELNFPEILEFYVNAIVDSRMDDLGIADHEARQQIKAHIQKTAANVLIFHKIKSLINV